MKIAGSSLKGQKTLWEKKKLLVTSIFSFSRNVFEKLLLQKLRNKGSFYIVYFQGSHGRLILFCISSELSRQAHFILYIFRALTAGSFYSIYLQNSHGRLIFSSTGRRPASYCHGIVFAMRPSVHPCVHP